MLATKPVTFDESYLNDAKIIDFDVVERLGVERGLSLQLIGLLCESLPQDLEAIKRAENDHNLKDLKLLLHKLKGGLSYCGVPRLKNATDSLHDTIHLEDELSEKTKFLFHYFYQEADILLKEYKQYL